ncbi:hypothetical protein ACFL0V_06425 [Nanoarchaeota archaeon]
MACGDDTGKPSESASCIYVLPPDPNAKINRDKGSVAKDISKPSKPVTGKVGKPVETAGSEMVEENAVPADTLASVTGATVTETEDSVITLKTGWWLLSFLVAFIILLTIYMERRQGKNKGGQQSGSNKVVKGDSKESGKVSGKKSVGVTDRGADVNKESVEALNNKDKPL